MAVELFKLRVDFQVKSILDFITAIKVWSFKSLRSSVRVLSSSVSGDVKQVIDKSAESLLRCPDS